MKSQLFASLILCVSAICGAAGAPPAKTSDSVKAIDNGPRLIVPGDKGAGRSVSAVASIEVHR